jgi:branched-chain amino acid transport system ATP-binding protein
MLEVRNITVAYGKIEALRGVNLKVPEGQMISVIGSNGAGKTTLLNTISGLDSETPANIKIPGQREEYVLQRQRNCRRGETENSH